MNALAAILLVATTVRADVIVSFLTLSSGCQLMQLEVPDQTDGFVTAGGNMTNAKRTAYSFGVDDSETPQFTGSILPYVVSPTTTVTNAGTLNVTVMTSGQVVVEGLPAYQSTEDTTDTANALEPFIRSWGTDGTLTDCVTNSPTVPPTPRITHTPTAPTHVAQPAPTPFPTSFPSKNPTKYPSPSPTESTVVVSAATVSAATATQGDTSAGFLLLLVISVTVAVFGLGSLIIKRRSRTNPPSPKPGNTSNKTGEVDRVDMEEAFSKASLVRGSILRKMFPNK